MENLAGLALPILFIGVLYLLLIRPQQKRAKEHRQLVTSLSVGDDVITIGGLHGRVTDVTDDTMDLEVTDDIIMRFQRTSLAKVVTHDDELDEVDEVDEVTVDEDSDED